VYLGEIEDLLKSITVSSKLISNDSTFIRRWVVIIMWGLGEDTVYILFLSH